MDEIVKWQQVSDEERDAIIDQLKGEKTTHTCPSCGEPAHCDISAGKSHCWCFDIERRELPESASSHQLCYCRKCLSKLPEL
jgi:transposase